jgi:hypothetical protein
VSDAGFSLELPPLAEHLGTARSFSAAVARHVGARENGRTLRFEVSSPDHQGALPERDVLDELGAPARIELIRALFADADVAASDGHRVVRFTVPLP